MAWNDKRGGGRPKVIDREALARDYETMTARQVAAQYNVSTSTVFRIVREVREQRAAEGGQANGNANAQD